MAVYGTRTRQYTQTYYLQQIAQGNGFLVAKEPDNRSTLHGHMSYKRTESRLHTLQAFSKVTVSRLNVTVRQ